MSARTQERSGAVDAGAGDPLAIARDAKAAPCQSQLGAAGARKHFVGFNVVLLSHAPVSDVH